MTPLDLARKALATATDYQIPVVKAEHLRIALAEVDRLAEEVARYRALVFPKD